MTNVYQGADGFYYEVGYRKMPSDGTYTPHEERNMSITEFEVPTPGVDQTYQFYVRSHNELGPGPEPKIITNTSGAPSKNYFKVFSHLISILLAKISAQVNNENISYLPGC